MPRRSISGHRKAQSSLNYIKNQSFEDGHIPNVNNSISRISIMVPRLEKAAGRKWDPYSARFVNSKSKKCIFKSKLPTCSTTSPYPTSPQKPLQENSSFKMNQNTPKPSQTTPKAPSKPLKLKSRTHTSSLTPTCYLQSPAY